MTITLRLDEHGRLLPRCCDSHRETDCCDPADCGPCCADCPNCPTLRERRRASMDRAVVTFGDVSVLVCERVAPERGIVALRSFLLEARVNPAAVHLDGDDEATTYPATGQFYGRTPGENWAPVS